MSKLETAAQFISLMEEDKYANKINAQRAAGRTHLSEGEKKKAFAAIEAHFGSDDAPAPPRPGKKKMAKKTGKKKASKKVTAQPPAETAAPAGKKKKAGKKAGKKKVTHRAELRTPPEGTLPISPSEAKNVGDVLTVIDSTVAQSVRIMDALKRADEIHKSGDISKGVEYVKSSLVGAAQLLQESVVDPLRKAGTQTDAEVASRLQQVVRTAGDPFQNDLATLGSNVADLQQPAQPPNMQSS